MFRECSGGRHLIIAARCYASAVYAVMRCLSVCLRANVTPIFKKGSRGLPENYRPVSLTSQCSKLFEAIVRTKKKDGPVSGLKSAGPRGRFQFLGAAGPVSYL